MTVGDHSGAASLRPPRGVAGGAWWWRAAAEVGIVCGTLPGVWLTLVPGPRAGAADGAVSLVPLRDLPTMSTFQVVGNLLLFATLGLLGPLRFPALRSVLRVTVLAAVLSGGIETAQHVLRLDRVSSVDDVLLNTAGACVASVVSLAVQRCWRFAVGLRAGVVAAPVAAGDDRAGV